MQKEQRLDRIDFSTPPHQSEGRPQHGPSLRLWVTVRIGCLAVILAVAGGCLWYGGSRGSLTRFVSRKSPAYPQIRHCIVNRGSFQIGLVEEGQVRAMRCHVISSDLMAPTKITYIIPEGTVVHKDVDVLVRFETKALIDSLAAKRVELESATRQLAVAGENMKIEQAAGQAAASTAASSLKTARAALDRFTRLDAPRAMRELDVKITGARKALADADKALRDSRRNLDDGMSVDEEQRKALESQVETAKEQLVTAKKTVESLLTERKMLRAYDYPRDLDARTQDVQRAELELAKARVATESTLMAKQAEVAGVEATIDRIRGEIGDLQMELTKCEKKAPVDGIVLHGDAATEFMNSQTGEIRIGSEVYAGQAILTIPDLSVFEVDILVGEEIRGKIDVGCKGTVTFEAVPGLRIDAELVRIDCLAQPVNPYDSASPKGFKGVVRLMGSDTRIISGMTAKVELLVRAIDDAVMIPLEAAYSEQGGSFCYVLMDETHCRKQPVSLGESNEDCVEVLSGLGVGDQVALSRPPAAAILAAGPQTASPVERSPVRMTGDANGLISGIEESEDRT